MTRRKLAAVIPARVAFTLTIAATLITLENSTYALAQSVVDPDEILSEVAEKQKVQAQLEVEMRVLRSKLEAVVQELKSWSLSHARSEISWRMTAGRVEMGFFNHDIIARSEHTGIELRCRIPASENNQNLENTVPVGALFTCKGTLQPITSSASKTIIVLENAGISALKSSGQAGHATGPANSNLRPEPPAKLASKPDDALAGTLLRQPTPSEEGIFRMGTFAGQLMWAQEHCSGTTSPPTLALFEAHRSHNAFVFDRGGRAGYEQCKSVAKAYTTGSSCKAIEHYYGPIGSMLPGAWISK